jgi:hypothetical protein
MRQLTAYHATVRRWVADQLSTGGTVAALCLAALLACSAGGSGDGPSAPAGAGATPSTRVPDELVGTWYSGDVSPTQFYNPSTGQWGGSGYSKGLFYTFTADGRYEYGLQLTSQLYGCGTLTQFYVTGTIAVNTSARSYTLHPAAAKRLERNTCAGTQTESRYAETGESNYYQVRVGGDGAEELLTRKTDGSDPAWYRMRRLSRRGQEE